MSGRSRPRNAVRLQVEQLEDRWVPTALNLTTAGASGSINGALFQQVAPQPTGTGVIQSFVRMESHGPKQTIEQGYNTDARPVQFDEKTSPPFEHSLQLSQLQTATDSNGTTYRVFLLDINQKSSAPLLSLDELRIYVSPTSGSLTGYDATHPHTLAGLPAVYDMGDNWVKLDASLNHGSGSGDMLLYVPNSVFGVGNPYVYLYSKFGVNNATNGGFEEWAPAVGQMNPPPPPVLPPATISGTVFGANAGLVVMFISGSDTFETETLADGTYHSPNLPPGTYSVSVAGYFGQDGGTVNSTPNGSAQPDGSIGGIVLGPGNDGLNYNFDRPPS